MNNHTASRLILIPPDKLLLKSFKGIYTENVLLQNLIFFLELPFLRIPLALITIILSGILLLAYVPFWVIEGKVRANKRFDSFVVRYFKRIPFPSSKIRITKITEDVPAFFKHLQEMQMVKIVYIQKTQIKLYKKANQLKVKGLVDEIWLYEDQADLIYQCREATKCVENSFIIGFDHIRENKFWIDSLITKQDYSLRLNRFSEVLESYSIGTVFYSYKAIADQRKFSFIYLNQNTFLKEDSVLYFPSESNKIINDYVEDNFAKLDQFFREKKVSFIRMPGSFSNLKDQLRTDVTDFIQYEYPFIFSDIQTKQQFVVSDLLNIYKEYDYKETIKSILGLPDFSTPVLLHCVEKNNDSLSTKKHLRYSIYFLDGKDHNSIFLQFQFYVSKLRLPSEKLLSDADKRSLADINQDGAYQGVYFQLSGEKKNTEYDADEKFEYETLFISSEVKAAVLALKAMNCEKMVVASFIYMLQNLKEDQPKLLKQLNEQYATKIADADTKKVSRLVIDDQYRIWLPDYNNIEIVMSPLPKSFFFFMLRNPAGLHFKELNQHREELIRIYGKVGNRLDREKIISSINDLTDIRSNSVNEKCSRIKEAFLLKINDSLAQNYYVTGGRENCKLITLDRSLVHFNQTF